MFQSTKQNLFRSPVAFLFSSILIIILMGLFGSLNANPEGDYGDIPVGDMADNIMAYPGVLSRFVSFYSHVNSVYVPINDQGTWLHIGADFWLGLNPPSPKYESQQNPTSSENDCYPIIMVEGSFAMPGPNPLSSIRMDITTDIDHSPDQPIYVNVLVDQNRDGQFKERYFMTSFIYSQLALEWVVHDFPIYQGAGQTARQNFGYFRLAEPTSDVWIRIIVSDQPIGYQNAEYTATFPNWDGTMKSTNTAAGEIEDFLMTWQTDIIMNDSVLAGPQSPKDGCFLNFVGVNPQPLFILQNKIIKTPWSPIWAEYGFFYDVNDRPSGVGCVVDPNAAIGIYGFKLVAGAGQPPVNARSVLGNAILGNLPITCNVGPNVDLPAANPLDPINFPVVDAASAPVTGLAGGAMYWQAQFTDPPRFRRYAGLEMARGCGCEIQYHSIVPGFDDSTDYLDYDLTLADTVGRPQMIYYENGDLLEQFYDSSVEPERPFPDPDFELYTFEINPEGFAQLSEAFYLTPPYSLYLYEASYIVNPTIPKLMRANQIRVSHSGIGGGTVTATPVSGDAIGIDFGPSSGWGQTVIDLPAEFELAEIELYGPDTYYDSLIVGLESAEYPYWYGTDCNNNELNDFYEISIGMAEDANGNHIPDECDGYSPSYICGDANSDESVDISDAVFVINYAFGGGPAPNPPVAGDANCDDSVDISDAVYIINFAFGGGTPPCDPDGDGNPEC